MLSVSSKRLVLVGWVAGEGAISFKNGKCSVELRQVEAHHPEGEILMGGEGRDASYQQHGRNRTSETPM